MAIENILSELNQRFDHTCLKSDATASDIIKLCEEARQWQFFAVVVNPTWVIKAQEELRDSKVKIVTVCGFPLGAGTTDVKVIEAAKGVNDGAYEIDMVANIGWLADDDFKRVEKEISIVRKSLPDYIILKVIIEAGILSEEQQTKATQAVVFGGAQFVKTCTGFFGGVTNKLVQTLYQVSESKIAVKASGGIRNLKQCLQLLEAGATRLGCSCSVDIMKQK